MGTAIVTLKIMPLTTEVDLTALEAKVKEKIKDFCNETETKTEIEPIAFGLKALKIIFVMDESKGGTDPLEQEIQALEDVNSVEVVDVRRALG